MTGSWPYMAEVSAKYQRRRCKAAAALSDDSDLPYGRSGGSSGALNQPARWLGQFPANYRIYGMIRNDEQDIVA
jgi:hypothetical protein